MPDWMLDLVLPRTDAAADRQWLVMAPVWFLIVVVTRRWSTEARLLVWGLITVNLAWFLIRMAH